MTLPASWTPTTTARPTRKKALYKNKYNVSTPRLLRAVYNYQFVAKDRGAFTQNPTDVIQRLRDSLADLGNVAMDRMARP